MQIDTYVFVVWSRRSAKSIFGAASNPVMVNGKLLCFRTEEEARAESDRLNGRSSGSHVRYRVRPIRVQMKLPSALANGASAPMPTANGLSVATPRAA